MKTMSTNYTIQDYLAMIDRQEVRVNREYQRNDKVWPDAARSYLIETILLNFPIPKLALHQITDVMTGRSHKELVDGQQRTSAIQAFVEDRLRLSSAVDNESLRGLRFSDLDIEQRTTILNYQLSADLFLAAEPSQIREVFRRMNSYTVPLNPEEQRHASYQGQLKWLLHRLGIRLNRSWEQIGTFSEKSIVRMADVKLLAEIVHAILFGITTTNKQSLDALYRRGDDSFLNADAIEAKIDSAMAFVQSIPEIHRTALAKPFQLYSLVLAHIHLHHPIDSLVGDFSANARGLGDRDKIVEQLTAMAQAIEDDDISGEFSAFVKASREKTNVRSERVARFIAYCKAMERRIV